MLPSCTQLVFNTLLGILHSLQLTPHLRRATGDNILQPAPAQPARGRSQERASLPPHRLLRQEPAFQRSVLHLRRNASCKEGQTAQQLWSSVVRPPPAPQREEPQLSTCPLRNCSCERVSIHPAFTVLQTRHFTLSPNFLFNI